MDMFDSKVLHRDVHERLVEDIDNIVADAGIDKKWVATPLGTVCREGVVEWTRRFKFHPDEQKHSLLVTCPDADDVCGAIAGALLRNFLRARVFTLQDVIAAYRVQGRGDRLDLESLHTSHRTAQRTGRA